MVIWIIGMSASGKTTIGEKLYRQLEDSQKKWVFLDGDTFRNILGEDLGHTLEDRRKNAYRISRFCEFLSSQDINVVACVLSIFHDNQQYNRETLSDYKEVYIDVEFETLLKRDNKDLYRNALLGQINNVVGVDIEFNPPYAPDMIIDNNQDMPNYEELVNNIMQTLGIPLNDKYRYTNESLLQHPQKYEYSKFEGRGFFEKYTDDRQISLKFFSKRIYKLDQTYEHDVELESKNYISKDNIILKEFLIYIINSNKNGVEKEKKKIDILIKRFEVGKKLYLTYSLSELKKSSLEYDYLLNYPLFSLVLQKYYNTCVSQKKFVYLNAILKVNDIISSIKSDFILYDEIYYAIKAFKGESNIIGAYL